MGKFVHIRLAVLLGFGLSCNSLKLDSEKNCLNQQAACFKWDKTAPQYVSATPTPNTLRTILPTITLIFSEDLKNGEDKSAYVLSGQGAQGLSVAAVKKISSFTYEVSLNGSILASAPINLDFSALKDYSNNFISGQTSITYTGNVAVGITGSSDHNGISLSGYPSITVNFQHSYATDPENTWQISVTSGVVYCGAGVNVESSATGVYLQSGVNQISSPILVTSILDPFGDHTAPLPSPVIYRVVVCVKNKNNANVQSLWSWQVIRDDTAPTSSGTPVSDSYGTTQNFTITCNDNAETIAINSVSGTSNPGAPTSPTFNVSTGAINPGTGSAYTGTIAVSNFLGNPTYVNYKWRCMDVAGHQDAAVQSLNLVIDTNIPAVNVTLSGGYHAYVSNTAGGYTSTTFSFSSDQISQPYRIASGATLCSPAGGGASIIGVGPFTTNAVANGMNGPHVVPASTFVVGATDVRICVRHSILTTTWGTAYVQIIRDDTAPVFTSGLTTLSNPGDGTITLGWNPATDTSPIQTYEICQSTTAGACTGAGFTATYQVAGPATSYQVTGLSPSTTYYYVVRARDMAGNRESNNVEKKSRITLGVTVTGYSSAIPDFRVTEGISTLSFTSNTTQSFTNIYTNGQAYSIQIVNQPGGQVCSFIENQFGNIFADTTLNVTCVTGNLLAKRLQPNVAAPLNYDLYRGNVSSLVAAGILHPCEMTYTGGFLYYGDYTNENPPGSSLCSGNNCRILRANASTGALTTISGTLSGVVRGIATDGTNLYYTISGQTGVYKIPVAGGTQLTVATGFTQPLQIVYSNNEIFVADGAGGGIKKISLATGLVTLVAATSGNGGMEVVGSTLYFITTSHTINSVPVSGGTPAVAFGSTGVPGFRDGPSPLFNNPQDLVADGLRNLYVTEYNNNVIRRIDLRNNRVTTITGRGVTGAFTAGVGPTAIIQNPVGIASDGRNLYANLHNVHRTIKITDSGLVGYWPIDPGVNPNDYNSDNTTVLNGTVNGGPPSTLTDRFGTANQASLFNGTQYITAATTGLPSGNAARTMCAWIKPSALPTGNNVIATYGNMTTNQSFGLYVTYVGGFYYAAMTAFGGAPNDLIAPYIISTTQWTHLCASTDTITAKLYLNGKLLASGARTFATGTAGFRIGTQQDGSQGFAGGISDVRLYSRALNEGEINELAQDANAGNVGPGYNSGATGLLAHYEFSNSGMTAASGPVGGALSATGSPTAVIGKDGDTNGAFNYNGGQYHISANPAGLPQGAASRTQCAWIKPNDYPGIIYTIMRYGDTGAPGGCSDLLFQNNAGTPQLAFGSCGSTAAEYTNINYKLPLNTWSHVCGTLAAGNVVNIYVNGVSAVSTTGVTTNWQSNPAGMNLQLANFNGVGGYAFNGAIDDLRIYNNDLSQAQIRQLATQVPAGLVARYDMLGDASDVSGFANNLTVNGATLTSDRFAQVSSVYNFNGSNSLSQAPLILNQTDNITLAAWVRLTAYPASLGYIVENGNFNGHAMQVDSAGYLNPTCPGSGNLASTFKIPLNVWTHVAVSYATGGNWVAFMNGNFQAMSTCVPIAPTALFSIGARTDNAYFATGNIDDVRIYNRVLGLAEIRALVQQPNKYIYVTANTYNGNLGGLAGADAKCNIADANKPATGTYKAMLVNTNSATLRRACNSGNCTTNGITEGVDWVLRPNITYLRGDGVTPTFTANWNGVFDFVTGSNNISGLTTFTNPVNATAINAWTGMASSWAADIAQCGDWDNNVGGPWPDKGVYGDTSLNYQSNGATPGVIYNGWSQNACVPTMLAIYCVEQ